MNLTLPRLLKILIFINVGVFLVDYLTHGAYLYRWLAMDPGEVTHHFQWWRLVTYMFVHDTSPPFLHILFNMLMLFMFGAPLVPVFGERRFLIFYLSSGFFAGLCSLVFYAVTHNPTVVIGASGALFALLFAFARLFPTQEFLMFFLFPVQARYAVLIIGGIELLLITSNDRIAHIAHLGGALFGWMWFRLEDQAVSYWEQWKSRKPRSFQKAVQQSNSEVKSVMIDIDPILKKISERGIGSLTHDEKIILEKASEVKRKQRSKVVRLEDWRQGKRDE
jgi:membrane associated rhomboid family serine protease